MQDLSGPDPGFPIEGGANPPGVGANIWFCQIFRKTVRNLEEMFGPCGGGRGDAGGAPLDPSLLMNEFRKQYILGTFDNHQNRCVFQVNLLMLSSSKMNVNYILKFLGIAEASNYS